MRNYDIEKNPSSSFPTQVVFMKEYPAVGYAICASVLKQPAEGRSAAGIGIGIDFGLANQWYYNDIAVPYITNYCNVLRYIALHYKLLIIWYT